MRRKVRPSTVETYYRILETYFRFLVRDGAIGFRIISMGEESMESFPWQVWEHTN